MGAAGPLGSAVWPDVRTGGLLLVPVGSTEQHGPHLPLSTDTLVAVAVAQGAAARLPGALVGPPIAIGASGEHAGFPGTLSIGLDGLRLVLVELGRSASLWAGRIVFVNGHGGNAAALESAVGLLVQEGRAVSWVPCAVLGADPHAGRAETSLLLHLAPQLVREDRAAAGDRRAIEDLLPALRADGVRAVSPNGVLGDPAGASAAEGAVLLEAMIERATALIEASAG